MNDEQEKAIANVDAHLSNAGLPTHSDLLSLVLRLSYPDAGELLTLDDYRNIARNIVQPDGKRVF